MLRLNFDQLIFSEIKHNSHLIINGVEPEGDKLNHFLNKKCEHSI